MIYRPGDRVINMKSGERQMAVVQTYKDFDSIPGDEDTHNAYLRERSIFPTEEEFKGQWLQLKDKTGTFTDVLPASMVMLIHKYEPPEEIDISDAKEVLG